MSIKLSIIIVSYNTKTILDDCIASIYNAQWKSSYEIIVVDNNSGDGSVEMLYDKYPQVKVIANTDNKLFARANNQGAKIAKGEYLLLLNSDTLVWGDNLQQMVDYFDSLPENVICIGPKILNSDRTLQSQGYPIGGIRTMFVTCFKLYKIIPPLLLEWLCYTKGFPRKNILTREVGWLSGSCMMVKTALFLKIGGLNERLEFYGEEPEFGYRCKKEKLKSVFYADSEIIHLGGLSTSKHKEELIDFRRYALLVKETCGYKKAIRISQIVLYSLMLKLIITKNKDKIRGMINRERRVINYLRKQL